MPDELLLLICWPSFVAAVLGVGLVRKCAELLPVPPIPRIVGLSFSRPPSKNDSANCGATAVALPSLIARCPRPKITLLFDDNVPKA